MAAVKDSINNLAVKTITQSGPASYATGGFLVDATATHSWLGFINPSVTVLDALIPIEYEILLNKDLSGNEAFGKAVVKILKHQYQKASSGSVTGQPGGVTVQSALSNTTATTHTHPFTHSHGNITSGAMAQAGAGSNAGASPDELGHVHVFTLGAATVTTTPAGGSHSHPVPFQYNHDHPLTTALTDVSLAEMANGTNLSTLTFAILVIGFGKS